MKKSLNYRSVFLVIIFPVVVMSCNNGPSDDSKKIAEQVNDKKLRNKDAEQDAQYLVDAAAISYDCNRMADVALTNGTGKDIKNLATHLKDLNANLIPQLNNIAGRKAITLPTAGTEKTIQDAGAMVDKAGNEFNKQWLDKTRVLHAKQLQIFESASGSATDSTIKNWFNLNLPVIQKQKAALDSVAGIIVQ